MTTSDALAATGGVLAVPTLIAWIVMGVWYGGESSYERSQHHPWFWRTYAGSVGTLTVIVVVIWLAAIWGGVQ